MKVVSTDALTKLIQLVKSAFISVDDTVQTSEVDSETIVGWGMPDYSAGVSVSSVTASTPYTATKNGFLFGTTYYCVVYVNGSQVGHADDTTYAYNLSIPLSQGDIVTITGSGNFGRCNFYPCKGV